MTDGAAARFTQINSLEGHPYRPSELQKSVKRLSRILRNYPILPMPV